MKKRPRGPRLACLLQLKRGTKESVMWNTIRSSAWLVFCVTMFILSRGNASWLADE